MKKLTLVVLGLLWLGTTTFAQTAKVDSSAMVTLRIDPETAKGATVSQIFDEVEFIPLETTKESLFGKIYQLKATKDYYVIYDYDTKSVLIFTKKGKFHAKISTDIIKQEEGDQKEQLQFFGFQLIKTDGTDQIRTYSRKNVYYFNLDAKLIRKNPISEEKLEQIYPFTAANKALKINQLKVEGKDSLFHEIVLFNKNDEVASYFPYAANRFKTDQYLGGSSTPIIDYGVANEFFYLRYYDFNIYKITPDAVSLAYRLIFPATNSLPKGFMDNADYKNKRIAYFQKNQEIFYGLTDTYQIGNQLFLKMRSMAFDKNKKNALIYHLQTGELTSIKDIEPDSLSSFLPITDAGVFYDYYRYGIHLFDNQSIYTSYSSLAMFTFKEQRAGKQANYNEVLTTYFNTQNKKSNPVLIRLKPKKL
ncbi:MAG: 6-bladed beta-propeller [Bacteroidota bacterium]